MCAGPRGPVGLDAVVALSGILFKLGTSYSCPNIETDTISITKWCVMVCNWC